MQDMELVQRIQGGDKEAEVELFSIFNPRISRRVCFSLGANTEDWKDIVSEIQIAVLLNLRHGKFDLRKGTSLASYIYAITHNKIQDYFRARKKQATLHGNLSVELHLIAEEQTELEKEELRNRLRQLLSKLDLKYKQVLDLSYYEGLSVSEISRRINLPPRRVSERINYAIKLLRKECKKENISSI
jgi:RNA polymerase sigma-70 factor (ECF subfamily)